MAITSEALCSHLDYTAWASRRLVSAVSSLPAEELTRDFRTADHSILGTLAHIYAADRLWFGRIQGDPPTRFIDPDVDMRLDVLQNDWPGVLKRWQTWAIGLNDHSLREKLSYKDLKGNPHQSPLWQIVLHVVNHGTHHRGQVSGFLRVLGHTPPPLDLIFYYREMAH